MRRVLSSDIIASDFFDGLFITPEQAQEMVDIAMGQIGRGNRGATFDIFTPEHPQDTDSDEMKIAEIRISTHAYKRPSTTVTLCFAGVKVHMLPGAFVARLATKE